MSRRRFYLGIDGGGTKTEFLCIDDTGEPVARSRTGTTYHVQIGVDGVERALTDGTADVCAQLGITPDEIAYTFVGLPAYGEDSATDPVLDALCARLFGVDRHACDNDMVCGWAGSLACEDGINLVAGTGSIGYGRRGSVEARAGGWGELFSDEGSAYWIAVQGLNAFTRMSDGRLPVGALHAAFSDFLSLERDIDLCGIMLGPTGFDRDRIAALAPLVSAAAATGDCAAQDILRSAGAELAAIAGAVRSRLDYQPGETACVSWSGGVLSQETRVQSAFAVTLGQIGGFAVVEPRWSPARGAAEYARLLCRTKNVENALP